jgi:hypothetical protein
MQTRRAQPAITFRSQFIADRLKLLARDGRSQVAIMEEAIACLPVPLDVADIDERRRKLEAILDEVQGSRTLTLAEFDALEYDEFGDLR